MTTVSADRSSYSSTSPSLLAKMVARDSVAWQQFFELYSPLILYWIRRQHVADQDMADVLQETLTAVTRSIATFRPQESGGFRAWLWVVTRNHIARHFRGKAAREQAVGGTDAWVHLASLAESLSDDPVPHTESSQFMQLTRRGLEAVRTEFEEKTWRMFWRTAVDMLPTIEVAAECGVAAATVRQARSRILRRLRQVLGEIP